MTNKELQHNIEQINLEFSAHLEKIVGKEIVRHVAYFKVSCKPLCRSESRLYGSSHTSRGLVQVGADDRVYFLWSAMISFERPGKSFAKHHRLALSLAERHRQSAWSQEHAHTNKLFGLCSQLKNCPVCDQLLPRSDVDFVVRP